MEKFPEYSKESSHSAHAKGMNEITEVIHLEICATLSIQQLSTKHMHPSTLKTEGFLDAIHIAEVSDCSFIVVLLYKYRITLEHI
jgi:hypothetical protein